MLTLICSIIVAALVGAVTYKVLPVSALVILLTLVILLCHVLATFLLRMYAKKVNLKMQGMMMEIQQKLQGMQNRMMHRPTGTPKQMMQQIEREQNAGIERMIEALELFKPLYPWSFFMKRQVNTMRMAFLFQQKKFDEVDALLPKCLIMDVQSVCIKLVRMYKNNDAGLDKFFKKKTRHIRANAGNTLLYAAYSWMLVQQERYEDAIKVLQDAKVKTCGNEVLSRNLDLLANRKFKQFSNNALAEQWYALMLEEPRQMRVQQQMRYR